MSAPTTALSLEAALPFEELVHNRITEPLGLTETTITLSADLEQRFDRGTTQI